MGNKTPEQEEHEQAAPEVDAYRLSSQARPSSPSKASPKRTLEGGLGRVFDVLMTQFADGHFEMSGPLRAWLGQRSTAVEKEAQSTPNVITAVVVALCYKEASNHQQEWSRAIKKAKAYLKQHGHPQVDHLI